MSTSEQRRDLSGMFSDRDYRPVGYEARGADKYLPNSVYYNERERIIALVAWTSRGSEAGDHSLNEKALRDFIEKLDAGRFDEGYVVLASGGQSSPNYVHQIPLAAMWSRVKEIPPRDGKGRALLVD